MSPELVSLFGLDSVYLMHFSIALHSNWFFGVSPLMNLRNYKSKLEHILPWLRSYFNQLCVNWRHYIHFDSNLGGGKDIHK